MPDLLKEAGQGVATLTINRPERRNAINAALCDEILAELTALADDESVNVVVLTGAGPDAFCAGGDVKAMHGIAAQDFDMRVANLRRWAGITMLLREMPKITIAMVNGVAAGAGLSLAAACDLRFAARSARFATAYARVGRSGDFGGTALLSRLIGGGRARAMYLLGETIDAATAHAYGLVTAVFDDDHLAAEAGAIARRLAGGPTFAHALIKQNFAAAERMALEDLIAFEAVNHARTGETEEHREAVAAFRDRSKKK